MRKYAGGRSKLWINFGAPMPELEDAIQRYLAELRRENASPHTLRAYGDGRYVDRGTATFNIEDRIKLYEAKTAGVTTEFQLAPFVG